MLNNPDYIDRQGTFGDWMQRTDDVIDAVVSLDATTADLYSTLFNLTAPLTGNAVPTLQAQTYLTSWGSRATTLPAPLRAATAAFGATIRMVTIPGGATQHFSYSEDGGATWTLSTLLPESNDFTDICWSSSVSLFCAVAQTGTNRIITSPDGITWSNASSGAPANAWQGVTYLEWVQMFAAVASSGVGNRVVTSPDGVTWTARTTTGLDVGWVGITATGGSFVAVASTGETMYSLNGVTWTGAAGSSGLNVPRTNIAFGGSGCVIAANNAILTSNTTGGDIKTAFVVPGQWTDVAKNGNFHVAVCGPGICTSLDGVTWFQQPPRANTTTIVCDGHDFLALGAQFTLRSF